MPDQLMREDQEDRHRPWFRRTTGDVLAAAVLLVLSTQVVLDMLVQ
jgi:hypothetical protein